MVNAASPKIAIVNDTSFNQHFGCDAVMAAIQHEIGRRGGTIVHRQPVGQDWRGDSAAERLIGTADLVLVNGEGTIHHDTPGAKALSAVAPFRHARGRPAFLFNATIQDNGARVMEDLRAFDCISVRDRRSMGELLRYGIASEVCGDFSFYHMLPQAARGNLKPIIVDSVRRDMLARLVAAARKYNTPLLSMKHRDGRLVRVGTDSPGPPIPDFAAYASLIGSRAWMLTGRYHAVCMAMNIGLPFLALPSNTWKIEALIEDAALNSARVILSDGSDSACGPEFSAAELVSTAQYLSETRHHIRRLFDRIIA